LFWIDGDSLEVNFGVGRHLSQRFLDFLTSIDAGRVEVTEVIKVNRYAEVADSVGSAIEKAQARVAPANHQRDVELRGDRVHDPAKGILF